MVIAIDLAEVRGFSVSLTYLIGHQRVPVNPLAAVVMVENEVARGVALRVADGRRAHRATTSRRLVERARIPDGNEFPAKTFPDFSEPRQLYD